MISVVIPTLNAASTLPECLAALQEGQAVVGEVVVVDGGSDDGTSTIAEELGATVIHSKIGRGVQLRKGADSVSGDWLLFLHSDSILARGWMEPVQTFIAESGHRRKAGYFRLRFDDDRPAARRLEAIVRWRARWLGLPYGDQGLLIARTFYGELGGFEPAPLMEDVKLVRKIGRRNLVPLAADIITSARRYQGGYVKRSLKNAMILTLYFLGVSPDRLARIYGR